MRDVAAARAEGALASVVGGGEDGAGTARRGLCGGDVAAAVAICCGREKNTNTMSDHILDHIHTETLQEVSRRSPDNRP